MSSFVSESDTQPLPQRANSRRKRRHANVSNSKDFKTCSSGSRTSYGQKIFVIDGSKKEGGGQIVRNALTIACLFGFKLHVRNVRAGRRVPGLRQQHLTGAVLSARLCGGTLGSNAKVKSTELKFTPANPNDRKSTLGKKIIADCKTAGSVTLLLQTCLPLLLFRKTAPSVELIGGTSVSFSPPYVFFEKILLPMLKNHFKAKFTASIKKEGFFPRGGGHVIIEPDGTGELPLHPIDLVERGQIEKVECYIKFIGDVWQSKEGRNWMSIQNQSIQKTVIGTLQRILPKDQPVKFYCTQSEISKGKGTPSTALEIQLIAFSKNNCILGGNALVNSKSLATIGKEAALAASNNLAKELKSSACVSEHLADQLLLFMALAKGTSRIRIRPIVSFASKHLETGIYLIKELLKDVHVRVYPNPTDKGETEIVECKGIGFVRAVL